jgi:hypothetical protein
MTAPTATEVSRRPIVGALAGLSFGLGLSLLLISFSVIALGTMTPLIVIVLGVVGGIALALLAPAPRSARAGAPMGGDAPPVAAYEAPPSVPPEAPTAAAYQPPPTPAPPAAPPPVADAPVADALGGADEPPPPPPPGPAGPPLRP